MLTAALWGLIQGLTEFLPVSSSGHLVLLPAIFGFDEPGLAASVMLHLGTLVAVVAYYRRDLLRLLHLRSDPEARRILMLLAIGTVPAAIVGSDPRRAHRDGLLGALDGGGGDDGDRRGVLLFGRWWPAGPPPPSPRGGGPTAWWWAWPRPSPSCRASPARA